MGDEDENSLDYQRREYLHTQDVLYIENSLIPFTKQKFAECQAVNGVDQVNGLMSQVDTEIVLQFQRMLA